MIAAEAPGLEAPRLRIHEAKSGSKDSPATPQLELQKLSCRFLATLFSRIRILLCISQVSTTIAQRGGSPRRAAWHDRGTIR
jgi:hypothetical protein